MESLTVQGFRSPLSNKRQKIDCRSNNHYPVQEKTPRRCSFCTEKGIRKRTYVSCKACGVGLCINCFEAYHNEK